MYVQGHFCSEADGGTACTLLLPRIMLVPWIGDKHMYMYTISCLHVIDGVEIRPCGLAELLFDDGG